MVFKVFRNSILDFDDFYINKSKQNGSNPAEPLGGPEGPEWYSFPRELEKACKAGYFSSYL